MNASLGSSRGLIVLGMHRSGTSCVSLLLNSMGAAFSKDIDGSLGGEENPKGFWEHPKLRDICNQLLQCSGNDWWSVQGFSAESIHGESLSDARRKFSELILELTPIGPWFIKEPRLCILLPVLIDLISNPIVIHVWRNPVEVATSLGHRDGFPLDFGVALWGKYVRSAFQAARDKPSVLVSYNRLISNPRGEAQRLLSELKNLGVSGLTMPSQNELSRVIDANLARSAPQCDATDILSSSQLNLLSALMKGQIDAREFTEPLSNSAFVRLNDAQSREAARITLQSQAAIGRKIEGNDRRREKENLRLNLEIKRAEVERTETSRKLDARSKEIERLTNVLLEIEAKGLGVRKLVGKTLKLIARVAHKNHFGYFVLGQFVTLVRTGYLKATNNNDPNVARDYYDWTRRLNRIPEPPVIIVPVYNAARETEKCLQSILTHTSMDYRLVVIDDASTDPKLADVLSQFEDIPNLELYRNETNLGFTKTVNHGMSLAGRSDVILLNSDTMVTPRWLNNLQAAAYSSERIATATALSNNSGAFSIPKSGEENEIPKSVGLVNYARTISQLSRRIYPTTPTGNGFCMYVRRACIDEVGDFDAKAFPRGYGEENDFCMRAGRMGWKHVVDDATFIFHVRSASFGNEKEALIKTGRAVIDQRYPKYTSEVRDFINGSSMLAVHARAEVICKTLADTDVQVKPRVLFVISTKTGGTPQTNQDLMQALKNRYETFVLRCDSQVMTLHNFSSGGYVQLEKHCLQERIMAFPHQSEEYDGIVAKWLIEYSFELVHVRHIAWHSLGLIEQINALKIPVIFSFHDYYTICPTIKLLDNQDVYCKGICTDTSGDCKPELWKKVNFPQLKNAAVYQWQRKFTDTLIKCSGFVTTTQAAKDSLLAIFPFLNNALFPVIPHGRDFRLFIKPTADLSGQGPLKILVPGNIEISKGAKIIVEIARKAVSRNIEIHIIGDVSSMLEQPLDGIVLHGPYQRSELQAKIRDIQPHIGGVFSIWPETYCHTLTELWASGLPVIGFDIGAVGDRIKMTGAGWTVDQFSADAVLEVIDQIRSSPTAIVEKREAVEAWQKGTGLQQTCAAMADEYDSLYRSVSKIGA